MGESLWVVSDPPHLLKSLETTGCRVVNPNITLVIYDSKVNTFFGAFSKQHMRYQLNYLMVIYDLHDLYLRKLILDCIFPTCIQKLRVKLAARVFDKEVQDLMLFPENKVRIAKIARVRSKTWRKL